MANNPLTTILEQEQPELLKQFQHIVLEKKRSHAYLFIGDFASWEMTLWLTQYQFCDFIEHNEPCGQCRTCRLIADNEFADMTVIEPTNGMIKTDTIRSLRQQFSSSSIEGKNQVVIIKSADQMHVNAANSLLKVMEEPQSHLYMILLIKEENHLLPTIKSRCQSFYFAKNHQMLVHELEKCGVLKQQAIILSEIASSVNEAKQLASDNQMMQHLKLLEHFSRLLISDKWAAYLQVSQIASQIKDKNTQAIAFQILTLLLGRDLKNQNNRMFLEKLLHSQDMWRHNVSFQNALEYMIIKR